MSNPDPTLPLPAELARDGGGERFGRFHLSRRLGAGVSHDLWHAWDPEKQAWLALRVWPRPPAGEKERVLAAGKHAKATGDARIVAPAGGGLEAGQLWYARPYIEALPVRDIPWQDGRTLAFVAKEAAEALAAAHGKGLAHGRVTAGNLLVASREEKGRGWSHRVYVTEFGLGEGDAAGDVRGLGRVFCELTGQPAPGGGPTTKAAPRPGGDTTAVKTGETTREGSSEERAPVDGALAGIFLRARDGQLDAAGLAGELGAWLARAPAAAGKRRLWPAAVVAGVVLAAGAVVLATRNRGAGAAAALAESAAAEAEGRLEAALERARAAAAADPADARAREAVRRLEAAVAARDASIAAARDAEQAAQDAERRVAEARRALSAAGDAARAPSPDRALIDRLLAVALDALGAALRARPGHAPALRLLEDAATFLPPGELARLPKDADGRTFLTPAIALRADLQAWVLSWLSVRGGSIVRKVSGKEARTCGLQPAPAPPAGAAASPVPLPDPSAPGRVARIVAEGPGWDGEPASAGAWRTAARALLTLELATAARAASPSPGDPFEPDLLWISGAADPAGRIESLVRAAELRPWDAGICLAAWSALRRLGRYPDSLTVADRAVRLNPACAELRVARAFTLYWLRRNDEALADCQAVADRAPDAFLVSAFVRVSQGDLAKAEEDCTEALRRDPALVFSRVCRAQVRRDRGNMRGALEDLDAALSHDPDRLEALAERASCRLEAGDRAGAIADCERALVAVPGDAEFLILRGWAHADAGEHAEAAALADRVLKSGSRKADALVLRAFVRLRENRLEDAVRDAEMALEFDSRDAMAHIVLGTVALLRGNGAAASESCERALRRSPRNPEALRLRSRINLALGRAQAAQEDADAVLAVRPDDVVVLHVRAQARLRLGAHQGALADCDRALVLQPRFAAALVLRARVRIAMLPAGTAVGTATILDDLDRALALAPGDAEALEVRASVLSAADRHREAADSVTRALDADPRNARLRDLRAGYRLLAGDTEGALDDAETLVRDAPKSAAGFVRRSEIRAKKGDLDSAKLDAVDATRVEPGQPRPWRQLGDVYRALGTKDRAVEAYRVAVRCAAAGDPDKARAEKALAELGEK